MKFRLLWVRLALIVELVLGVASALFLGGVGALLVYAWWHG